MIRETHAVPGDSYTVPENSCAIVVHPDMTVEVLFPDAELDAPAEAHSLLVLSLAHILENKGHLVTEALESLLGSEAPESDQLSPETPE